MRGSFHGMFATTADAAQASLERISREACENGRHGIMCPTTCKRAQRIRVVWGASNAKTGRMPVAR